MLLQLSLSAQQIAVEPSSSDIHFESGSLHLKVSGNRESTSLQILSSRANS